MAERGALGKWGAAVYGSGPKPASPTSSAPVARRQTADVPHLADVPHQADPMCGIAGVMMRGGRSVDRAVLDRLAAALDHRGPDSQGFHVDGPVGLVDTRLAIVDVEGGRQPLFAPGGAALVANGEIYNAPELRAELGGVFQTLSDCEPAVHLYERRGLDYAQALRGMYAIAIHDPTAQRLVLSRDQFGIKPLYYLETPELFAFASEPQALFAAGLIQPEIDPAAEAELLQLKYTSGEATIFDGIDRVAPGETVVVVDGVVTERRRIPTLADRPVERIDLAEALTRFEMVMTESVAVHLRTDVPYGLFFSGGVDSSILLKLMQRLSRTPVQALTVGYEGRQSGDESFTALELAKSVGADCRRIEMTAGDFWTLAPRIAAAIDDPTADPAVLPTYLLGRAAREAGLKVTLCGEGADELFGGYTRYRRARLPLPRFGDKERRGVFEAIPALNHRFAGWATGFDAIEARETQRWPSHMALLQAVDCIERLPNGLLIKLDRCLMANSVEGRTPFLDKAVADFALSLPPGLKANLRFGKVLLREWLSRALPQANPFAPKQGFNPPVGGWMAAQAERLGELAAAQPAIAEFASFETVRGVFEQAGQKSQPAWSLLFYALWHSHHVLGVPADGDIAEVLSQASRA
ncbi:asparagine synthase (glutamine-hydrolyzing) [Caulobacter sp. S45]|uniref:asparagine synthase (glutamine-hydrolyzing) n=1 Tax=Caulobacter sp. S45 TaxID=1641861 RepID=UPI001C205180|nr:asparagine synthase (glutamine-hydrolyzing) [Caulobacter sp. S45]